METGKLNDRIRIYEPKAGMNLTSLDDYELAGSVWANVRAVTTRDQIHSGIDAELITFLQISAKVKYSLDAATADLMKIRGLRHDTHKQNEADG